MLSVLLMSVLLRKLFFFWRFFEWGFLEGATPSKGRRGEEVAAAREVGLTH